jgi:hypothetical protein
MTHTGLKAILWINIAQDQLRMEAIQSPTASISSPFS